MSIFLQVVSTTSATSTIARPPPSPVECQVYANGSAWAQCQNFQGIFQPAWFVPVLYGAIIACVVFAALYAVRVYLEYPFGRFFWHKKGIKAILHYSGAPGVLGTLRQYSDKLFLFTSSGRKKEKFVRLILAVPGSMTHLRQSDGGDSVVLIDGDKGAPVNPEVEEWAEKNLNALAKSHNWADFALRTKYAMLTKAVAEANLFPPVTDWNPGTQAVNILAADGSLQTKLASQCSPEERNWYQKASQQAQLFKEDMGEAKAKTEAALNSDKSYTYKGQVFDFPTRKRTEWVEFITAELSQAQGNIANALIGGKQITTQYVASVMKHIPNGVYFDSAKAEIEEKVRKEMKTSLNDVIKLAIAAAIVIGAVAIAAVILMKVL